MVKIEDLSDIENRPNIITNWAKEILNTGNNVGELFEFIDIFNGNDICENIIWHYTKMNVLEKILQPDNVVIRFTNTNDSNDPLEALVYKPFLIKNKEKILNNLKEFEYYENIKKDFEELIENKENEKKRMGAYTFSMSRLKNSHAFWSKEYARLDGVAIGFNQNALEKIYSKDNIWDVFYVEPDKNIKLVDNVLIKIISRYIKIAYTEYDKPETLNILSSNSYTILSCFADILSSIVKHKSWKYERETRIVLLDRINAKLDFKREFIGGKKRVRYEKLSKDVIASVMLGPECNEEQVKEIKNYLTTNGYNNISVERSHAFDLLKLKKET
jgi:hypothetical protein